MDSGQDQPQSQTQQASPEASQPGFDAGADADADADFDGTPPANPGAADEDPAPDEQTPMQFESNPGPLGPIHGLPISTPSCASSWSASSDRQLGHGSHADPSDRVYPIRSVISVNPPGRASGEHDYFNRSKDPVSSSSQPPRVGTDTSSRRTTVSSAGETAAPAIGLAGLGPPKDTANMRRSNPASGSTSKAQAEAAGRHGSLAPALNFADDPSDAESDGTGIASKPGSHLGNPTEKPTPSDAVPESMITHRFKHVVTDEGHAVITGRDGTLQRCEDEPIHTPGAVQGFGLLLAIRETSEGRLEVRYVSENSKRIIGYTPKELFNLDNFLDILTEEQADNLLDHVDFIRDEDANPSVNGPEVFSMSIRPPKRRSVKLWCALHINPKHEDLVICEFELDDDHEYPLRPLDELTPDAPEDTLQSNPTHEELHESTHIKSKPLRILRSARKRRGEAGAMQVFDIMSQVQEQLSSAPNLESFLKILVGIVKELTGFHRVMIYQFDSSYNGKVVTELVDPVHTRDLYKGLHFPASDIPRQARDLYKLNKVRLLYDRDLETARLVCKAPEDVENPLDMSHAYLRAMSPIHLKYLGNMAVRSSMSISINAFDELWGLIACHSYGAKGMRVSFPIRKMCRLVGDTVSRNIERLSYASRLQARKLINTVPTDKNPSGYIIASSEDLLKLFDADFGILSIKGETKTLGKLEHSQEALAMLEYLRLRRFTSVVTTQDIKLDFPDLRYPPGFKILAGLLYVPLSVGGHDFIVFFRRGQIREVKWAGNPYEKVIQEGTHAYLEPRKSFRVWHETIVGKCREWSEEQVETAAVLCLVYGKFIEVWRQKEAALQKSRFTQLLLANSAHEVRTPLNAIINYLEIALEGTLDQETRDNLAKSHSASKSLIYVINDLLDLTCSITEEGQELIKDEIFDLVACIREATDSFNGDVKRKGIAYEITEDPGLPRHVYGDQRRLRQAVTNVTANAVQHTTEGYVRVQLYVVEVHPQRVRIEIVIEDSGRGMNTQQLDDLFQDLEQVSTDADDQLPENEDEKPQNTRRLGLGLAVVARIVRNMDGQLRVKSEDGKGSRFVMQLPFGLPQEDSPGSGEAGSVGPDASSVSLASVTASLPPTDASEVLLVDRGSIQQSTNAAPTAPERKSLEETNSINSHRSVTSKGSFSSVKSDADRLIDAIQTPLDIGAPESENVTAVHRSNSRGGFAGSGPRESVSVRSQSPEATASRPEQFSRSLSLGHLQHEVSTTTTERQKVTDSKTPIRPIKVPEDYEDQPEQPQPSSSSRVLFEIPDKSEGPPPTKPESGSPSPPAGLQVLIAEDDPINLKILRKRLEKAGHHVHHAVNGEDCATVYKERSADFDVVLMDMQMPIVDGLASTKMIRELEHTDSHHGLSSIAAGHGRTPIFAVSASLVEREKYTYINAGFDGWILKPIDFKRLNTLLLGITEDAIRNECLYKPGKWEQGGWFSQRSETP